MPFIGYLLSPIGKWIAGGLAILGLIGFIYWKGYSHGHDTAVEAVNRQTERAISQAHEAARNVDACYASGGVWSVPRAECERDSRHSGR